MVLPIRRRGKIVDPSQAPLRCASHVACVNYDSTARICSRKKSKQNTHTHTHTHKPRLALKLYESIQERRDTCSICSEVVRCRCFCHLGVSVRVAILVDPIMVKIKCHAMVDLVTISPHCLLLNKALRLHCFTGPPTNRSRKEFIQLAKREERQPRNSNKQAQKG
jgi:hypothetical protein